MQIYTKTVQTILEQLHIYGKTVVCWCLIFQSFLYVYILMILKIIKLLNYRGSSSPIFFFRSLQVFRLILAFLVFLIFLFKKKLLWFKGFKDNHKEASLFPALGLLGLLLEAGSTLHLIPVWRSLLFHFHVRALLIIAERRHLKSKMCCIWPLVFIVCNENCYLLNNMRSPRRCCVFAQHLVIGSDASFQCTPIQ